MMCEMNNINDDDAVRKGEKDINQKKTDKLYVSYCQKDKQGIVKNKISNQSINKTNKQEQQKMRSASKSQNILFPSKDPDQTIANQINNTNTQSPIIPTLKLPHKQQNINKSMSRQMNIATDQQDQIVDSLPTAKNTFISDQVDNRDKGLSRFYTPQKKDDRQEKTERVRLAIEMDMNLEPKNGKALAGTKGQKSRFYFKQQDHNLLDNPKVVAKELRQKPETLKEEAIKQGANKIQKGTQQGLKQQQVAKEVIAKQQYQEKDTLKQQKQQIPGQKTKMLSRYISKMNKSRSPYTPLQQHQQAQTSRFKKRPFSPGQSSPQQHEQALRQPRSSRFPHRPESSTLQQSHQKLFDKCYKQTYSHLKLMLKEIHQSQEQIHIVHKEITDTVFEIIKQRADSIRQQMNQLVEQIVTQWMKDEWQFVKSSQIQFMDDILQLQNQLNQRQQQIHSLVDRLVKQNNHKKHQNKQEHDNYNDNDQTEDIFHTFNSKNTVRGSINSSRNQTTWKKVTTDLLMFNYESNLIEIQHMIDKISKTSLDKCNKAINILPSSELFANDTHEEVLNPKAKKWFRHAVLTFMNDGTTNPPQLTKIISPKKEGNKATLQKTNHIQKDSAQYYKQYQKILDSMKPYRQTTPNQKRGPYQREQQHYPEQQPKIHKAYQQLLRKRQPDASPSKLYLDKTYYVSGRNAPYF